VAQAVRGAARRPGPEHLPQDLPDGLPGRIGLGADGLSSSAYGPAEAFKNLLVRNPSTGQLEGQWYLAIFLALATVITVFVISYAYSRVIEQFPHGGGGYVVATKLLGPRAGVSRDARSWSITS